MMLEAYPMVDGWMGALYQHLLHCYIAFADKSLLRGIMKFSINVHGTHFFSTDLLILYKTSNVYCILKVNLQ